MARPGTTGLTHRGVAAWMLCGLAVPVLAAAEGLANAPATPAPGVQGEHAAPDAVGPLRDFDIPAQPLDTALNRYADLANLPTLYSSQLVAGRMSSAVQGRYSSERALRLLLDGSGLVAERRTVDRQEIFRLREIASPTPDVRVGRASLFSADGYPGLVQARILQALCADGRTRPGAYRALFRFQVNAIGHIEHVRLVGSSGNARRDAALLETLPRVDIDMAPPSSVVQQPLTMLLKPNGPDTESSCDGEGS